VQLARANVDIEITGANGNGPSCTGSDDHYSEGSSTSSTISSYTRECHPPIPLRPVVRCVVD
jgi:hypothetical protein